LFLATAKGPLSKNANERIEKFITILALISLLLSIITTIYTRDFSQDNFNIKKLVASLLPEIFTAVNQLV